MLVRCAITYDSRLPYGVVPERIWRLLNYKHHAELMELMREAQRTPEKLVEAPESPEEPGKAA